jgi:lysophospholipase L1-like esterase
MIGLLVGAGTSRDAFAQKEAAPDGKKTIPVKQPLTVLCVGDSITAAPWGRRRLKANLDKAGYRTDFVGTQFGANPEGGFTDGEHEGYPGCKIEDVAAKLTAPGTGALARFSPDIVLVLLGTNDIGQGRAAGAADRLARLLGHIRKEEPKAHIFVGTITAILPNAFSGYNTHAADVDLYNSAARSVVTKLRTRDRRVHLVDINAALPATNDYIGDGVHPSGYGTADEKDGYVRMGDAWFRAIHSAI